MRLPLLLAAVCAFTARTGATGTTRRLLENDSEAALSATVNSRLSTRSQGDVLAAGPPALAHKADDGTCGAEDLRASVTERLNPFSRMWDNSIVICALMRLEHSADVREWLQYHRWVGVDHVLLHDNNEDGGKQAADLQDFIDDGFLSYFQIEGEKLQNALYETCVVRAQQKWAWLAAIDIDEFLVVKDPALKDEPKALKAVLEQHRFHTGLWLQWITYGPAEHDARPPVGGPLKHYDQCIRKQNKTNMFGKSIGNTFWLKKGSSAHGFMYRASSPAFSDAGGVLPARYDAGADAIINAHTFEKNLTGFVDSSKNTHLAVHHYSTRSREDFDVKMMRGAGDHERNVTYRDTTFFDERKEEQMKAPECQDSVRMADECCYRDGKPFPPPPPPGGPIPITPLLPIDSKAMSRGSGCRDTSPLEHNPMTDQWEATIVLCAHLPDLNMSLHDLKTWVEHHKRIGVSKVVFFADDSDGAAWNDPLAQKYVDAQTAAHFVEYHVVPQDSARHVLTATQELCVDLYATEYSFILFLEPREYMLLHGVQDADADLPSLLAEPTFRYSPGVVVPVYHFAVEDHTVYDSLEASLPTSDSCWQGELGLTRTIANTFWLIECPDIVSCRFRGDLLPVTDAGLQWVAAARHWPLPGISQPLEWRSHSSTPHDTSTPDPLIGLGSRLRVLAPDSKDVLRAASYRLPHVRVSEGPAASQQALCDDLKAAGSHLQTFLQRNARPAQPLRPT